MGPRDRNSNRFSKFHYLILFVSDNWDKPESFGNSEYFQKDNLYSVIKSKEEEDLTYNTGHTFPQEILTHCPDAPRATHGEVANLIETVFWREPSEDPGV